MKGAEIALPTFEVAEWRSVLVPGEALTAADRRLKEQLEGGEEGRLIVRELRSGVEVQARSWVGVVRFERFEVRVVPKLAGDSLGLVKMIEFATGIDALRRGTKTSTLRAEDVGLLDLIALLFAEGTEDVVRGGILADYVEREDDLPVVRGRLLGDQQVMRRFGQVDRLICRFDEHEQDIADNQLLGAALAQCATRVSHEGVRRRIRRLLALFQEVCRFDDLDLHALRGQMVYHRLNEHYRVAHELAWLLLDGLGTKDLLSPGKTRCFAFLLDMNRLFEMFVRRLVEKLSLGEGIRVHYQRGDRSILVDASTNQPYSRVIPDLLIEMRGLGRPARVAVDAKYKTYDEKKLSAGDIYQAFLYAYAYSRGSDGDLPAALVVYPSSTTGSQGVRLRVRSAQALMAAEILALGISIPAALTEVTQGKRGPATAALVEAILQGLGTAGQAAA